MLPLLHETTPCVLFEDRLGDEGAYLFHTPLEHLRCARPEDLPDFFARLEQGQQAGQWWVLAADYEAGCWFEPRLRNLPVTAQMQAWRFAAPTRFDTCAADALLDRAYADLSPERQAAGVAAVQASISQAQFCAAIERIQDYIRAGDCYQVNFTYQLQAQTYGSPLALYHRLRARQPVRYGAYCHLPGLHALSLSPELFVQRRASRVLSRPMKGTVRKTGDAHVDEQARAWLSASAKDRAENVMIVDLIRNDLGRVAESGSVRVDQLCAIESYPTVFQMVSDVSATVLERSLAPVFRALFPCGSITGAPKLRAMEIIHELEAQARGLYTGSLGWLAPNGDFNFNVAIRTLVLDQQGGARLGIGAGIVADSVAQAEYQECAAKARFVTELPLPFQFIETLRLDVGEEGACYSLLAGHLQRLAASCAYFGQECAVDQVREALLAHGQQQAPGAYRVRLLWAGEGRLSVQSVPLPGAPTTALAVRWAARRLDSQELFLRHKTTVRQAYDADLAALPSEVFDQLYLNERGEVCEGARCNVFVQRHGELLTPPLTSGLLPGVQRAALLQSGQARECVLYPDDVRQAEALYVSNALRGLLPARLI